MVVISLQLAGNCDMYLCNALELDLKHLKNENVSHYWCYMSASVHAQVKSSIVYALLKALNESAMQTKMEIVYKFIK